MTALLAVRKTRTVSRAVIVLVVATLALACVGCGSGGSSRPESRTPRAIVSAAKQALAHASSLTISGVFQRGGRTYSFDYDIGNRGSKGTTVSSSFRFKFIRVGGSIYVDVNAAYWKYAGGAALARRYGGVWLKGSASEREFASFAALITKNQLDKLLESQSSGPPPVLTNGHATVNGKPAVKIASKTLGITLYVAAKGTPYPLEMTKSGNAPEKFYLGGYNHPVSVAAPAHWINAP